MTTIMVVEDDVTMRSLLRTLLELEGFSVQLNVETSQDGIVDKILMSKPDALLMDVNLKGVNGLAVLEKVRADPNGKKICVVMASGLDSNDDCRKAGANKFFLKPYNPEELIRWLKKETSSS